jgi:hypothetical protein
MSEYVRLGTILGAFVLGWIVTVIALFIPPQGIVDSSVVVILGQSMTYCAAGLGIKDYVDYRTGKQSN